ncbi:MAG: serine/threonine-protein kinase [Xanthomonadales bacterium]|nr:serine/threonine-protein kinase [Xanthomonadales bacterium]
MNPEIPGFKIIRSLGAGAMAKVYLALDEGLDRQVALKVMNESLAHDPEFRDRFINEAKDTAKFNHEGIVKIFTTGVHQNHYFLALEYLEAGTLNDNLKARKKAQDEGDGKTGHLYGSAEALQLLKSLAEALSYAHDKHVVHRDIKPDNILFRSDGHAVLSDFGIAKSIDENKNLTMAGFRIGTPAYMSPEQMLGAEVDARSDIYSLGVVFYEILIGQRPYKTNVSEYSELIKQLDEQVPELPQNLSHLQPLLQKMLAKRPDQRVQSSHELIRLISQISRSEAPAYSDKTVIQPVIKDKPKPPGIWQKPIFKWLAPTLAGLAIIILAITFFMRQTDEVPQIEVQPVDAKTGKLIAELLESAQTYMEFEFIISPPVSNAVENFIKILDLQPGNREALVGLKQAETALLGQIEQEIENGNPNTAKSMIELGQHFFPNNEELANLLEQVSPN